MNVILPEYVPLKPIRLPDEPEDMDWNPPSKEMVRTPRLSLTQEWLSTPGTFANHDDHRKAERYPCVSPEIPLSPNYQFEEFDYICILDTDAVYSGDGPLEFTEVSVIVMNRHTLEMAQPFYEFVKPRFSWHVPEHISNISGLTDKKMNQGMDITKVLEKLEDYLQSHIRPLKTFTFVTLGNADLKTILPSESENKNFNIPTYLQTWVEIRSLHEKYFGPSILPAGLGLLMKNLGIKDEISGNTSLHDCQRLAKICKCMAMQDVLFRPHSF